MIFLIAFRLGSGAPKIPSLVLETLLVYPLIQGAVASDPALHGSVDDYSAIDGTPKVNKWLPN